MPYVSRLADGSIQSVSQTPLPGYEPIDSDSPELLVYLDGIADSGSVAIGSTDLDFVRVLEDVVELLVQKGVILFTELPDSAQEKMLFRQRLRSGMSGKLDLIGDD